MNASSREILNALDAALQAAAPSAPRADIELASFWVLQAELLGMPEFGVGMLARELARTGGDTRPTRKDIPTGPIIDLDASGQPGIVALAGAVAHASASLRTGGIGVVGMRGLGGTGILGLAVRSVAVEGGIALLAAQSPAAVAPFDAHLPAIGTNPLAIATPRAARPPLVVDFATSSTTIAAVRKAADSALPLTHGTAVDAEGQITTDPDSVSALLPAGLVGSLTGLLVEILAGIAGGGRVPAGASPPSRGATLIVIDPRLAGGADAAASAYRLDQDWTAAGGHLPARLDRLPLTRSDVEARIDIDDSSVELLQALAHGKPAG